MVLNTQKFYLGSEKAIGEISRTEIYGELLNTNTEESLSYSWESFLGRHHYIVDDMPTFRHIT